MIHLLKRKNGNITVQRGEMDQICPFMAPMPQQNSIGQMTFTNTVCGNHCPHFKFEKEVLTLGCGSTVHVVQEVKEEEEVKLFQLKK